MKPETSQCKFPYVPEVVSTTLSILSQYWYDEEIRKEESMYISKTEAQATFDAYINLGHVCQSS